MHPFKITKEISEKECWNRRFRATFVRSRCLQKPLSGVWSESLDFTDGVGSLPLNGAADGRGVEDDEAAGRGFGWKPLSLLWENCC